LISVDIEGGIAVAELPKLLLKAFRSLSDEEQETVVTELLEARSAPWPWSGSAVTPPPIGLEGGGPWQSVPVRLSTDQHERLKQWCQANGFTMAVVLRGLVARFLDDQAARRAHPPTEGPEPA
jgi:hypothetical protein